MAKSRQSGQKVPKMKKKGFTVFKLHGLAPLYLRLALRASRRRAVGAGPCRRRLAQGRKGPELVAYIFIIYCIKNKIVLGIQTFQDIDLIKT